MKYEIGIISQLRALYWQHWIERNGCNVHSANIKWISVPLFTIIIFSVFFPIFTLRRKFRLQCRMSIIKCDFDKRIVFIKNEMNEQKNMHKTRMYDETLRVTGTLSFSTACYNLIIVRQKRAESVDVIWSVRMTHLLLFLQPTKQLIDSSMRCNFNWNSQFHLHSVQYTRTRAHYSRIEMQFHNG